MNTHINSVAGFQTPSSQLPVNAALMLAGFSAVIGQVVLMRELMVVFSGNEISLGVMLATWPVSYTHLDVYKRQSLRRA